MTFRQWCHCWQAAGLLTAVAILSCAGEVGRAGGSASPPATAPAAAPATKAAAIPVLPPDLAAFDPEKFEKLAQPDRLALVLRALDWRESHLQNFAYDLECHTLNVTTDPAIPLKPDERVDMREPRSVQRNGPVYLLKGESRGRRFLSKWDGRVRRVVNHHGPTRPPGTPPSAGLLPEESTELTYDHYNHLLGFRSSGLRQAKPRSFASEPLPLPQVLRGLAAQRFPIRVDVTRDAGQPRVRVHTIGYTTDHNLLWLDPARQFLPVRAHHGRVPRAPEEPSFDDRLSPNGQLTYETVEAREVDGLWVPTRVVTRVRIENVEGVRTYVVRSFTRGKVTDDDLRLSFPEGATVNDRVGDVMYRVGRGGRPEPMRFAGADGKVRVPDEAELADAVAVNPIVDAAVPAAEAAQREADRRAAMQRLASRHDARRRARNALVGKPAPDFPAGAEWLNWEPLRLANLKGKVVVLDFFAEWCAPCRPDLARAAQAHRELAGEGIVLVGVHTPQGDRGALRALMAELKLTYPIYIDAAPPVGGKAYGATSAAYDVEGIPHALVLDADGTVAGRGPLADVLTTAEKLAAKRNGK